MYDKAVNVAFDKVNKMFPNYRKNIYFYGSVKGLYLLFFNHKIANVLFRLVNRGHYEK